MYLLAKWPALPLSGQDFSPSRVRNANPKSSGDIFRMAIRFFARSPPCLRKRKDSTVNMAPRGSHREVQLVHCALWSRFCGQRFCLLLCRAQIRNFAISRMEGTSGASALHGNPLLTMSSSTAARSSPRSGGSSAAPRHRSTNLARRTPRWRPSPPATFKVPLRRLRWHASGGHAGIGVWFYPQGVELSRLGNECSNLIEGFIQNTSTKADC